MKQCPQCRQTYDDELNFCLSDGTGLFLLGNPEETVIRQFPTGSTAPTVTFPAPVQTSTVQQSNNSRWLYGIILVLSIVAVGSVVALFYERNRADSSNNTQTEKINNETNKINSSANVEPKVSVTPAVEEAIENQKRYVVNSCGSIQDTRAGLEWYVGVDRNVTWFEAQEWTSGLNACGGGWRMPTIEEIRTLYNPSVRAGTGYYTGGKYFPAKIDPVFNAIGGGSWVWSNAQSGAGNARSFNLNQGKAVEFSATNTLYSTRAFAVRPLRK